MHKSGSQAGKQLGRQLGRHGTHACSCHMPHATCCRHGALSCPPSFSLSLSMPCLTKCLVDFWKICTTRRQQALWQDTPSCPLSRSPSLWKNVAKKCTKWRALWQLVRARRAWSRARTELIHFGSGTRQSHICGQQTRLSSFPCALPSYMPFHPLPCCPEGARIMHEVVIIRANSIENFVPNVRFASGLAVTPRWLCPCLTPLACCLCLSTPRSVTKGKSSNVK